MPDVQHSMSDLIELQLPLAGERWQVVLRKGGLKKFYIAKCTVNFIVARFSFEGGGLFSFVVAFREVAKL